MNFPFLLTKLKRFQLIIVAQETAPVPEGEQPHVGFHCFPGGESYTVQGSFEQLHSDLRKLGFEREHTYTAVYGYDVTFRRPMNY